jgi:hypothetical protein
MCMWTFDISSSKHESTDNNRSLKHCIACLRATCESGGGVGLWRGAHERDVVFLGFPFKTMPPKHSSHSALPWSVKCALGFDDKTLVAYIETGGVLSVHYLNDLWLGTAQVVCLISVFRLETRQV